MSTTLELPTGKSTDMFSNGPLGVQAVSKPDPSKVEYEIWFVHGLTGNLKSTWTHKNGTFWPALIANDFPTARVLTYGYDADVVKFTGNWSNAEHSDLRSYGENLAMAVRNVHLSDEVPYVPIYFIGHSLGGLVIEQALLLSLDADQSYKGLVPNTHGIFFMGTPHLGSHLTKWAAFIRLLIPRSIRAVNKDILEPLTKESNLLAGVEAEFQKMAKHGRFKHIKLFCFYEAKEMVGFSKKVVPRSAAVLPSDWSASISETHVGMVRFSGPEDSEYIKVKGQLMAWLTESRNIPEAEPPTGQEGTEGAAGANNAGGQQSEAGEQGTADEQPETSKRGLQGINQKGISISGGTFQRSRLSANPVAAGRDLNFKNKMWIRNHYNGKDDDAESDDEEDSAGRNTDSEEDSMDGSIADGELDKMPPPQQPA